MRFLRFLRFLRNRNNEKLAGNNIPPVEPTITVTAPNGAESWTSGGSENITWTSTGITGDVEISYSIDNGANYTAVATVAYDSSPYAWTIPVAISSTCLVKIEQGAVSDVSDATFTIGFGAATALYVDSNGGNVRVNDACGGIASSNISVATGTHVLSAGSHGLNNADKMTHSPATNITILNANLGAIKTTGADDVFSVILKVKHTAAGGGANTSLYCDSTSAGFWFDYTNTRFNVVTSVFYKTVVLTYSKAADTYYYIVGIYDGVPSPNGQVYAKLYGTDGSLLASGNAADFGGNYVKPTGNWVLQTFNDQYLYFEHFLYFTKVINETDIANAIAWGNTV